VKEVNVFEGMEAALVRIFIACFFVGFGIGIGGYLLINWLVRHISIGWI
jgi:hypothetical protein